MDLLGFYPLFYVPNIGSAWLMGLTGAIHIMASHTSVGAALLFAFLAHKAQKENRTDLYDYMKRYGMFLLIFSYVIGSITGPGIWYTATAASPRGISALIHNFVWVWATEWVFFVYEVLGVFALIYFIDKVDRKTHLKLTYTFAIASVGTLALIIGIISFMMWPGTEAYYATGSASDAFFGTNTFPHMFLRIGFMIMMSGIIGMIISSAMRKENKELSRRLCHRILLYVVYRHPPCKCPCTVRNGKRFDHYEPSYFGYFVLALFCYRDYETSMDHSNPRHHNDVCDRDRRGMAG
jgi:cytochrome bd-type quinol oxidase subunit 1